MSGQIIIAAGIVSFIFLILSKFYSEYEQELYINNITSQFNLTYKESENIISSKVLKDNHILLNESLTFIDGTLEICKNSSKIITQIPINISYTMPEFLENNTYIANAHFSNYVYGKIVKEKDDLKWIPCIKKECSLIKEDHEFNKEDL